MKEAQPVFNVPAPENMIREDVPPEVIVPEILTIPVEMRIWLNLVPLVVADIATDAAENVPAPTLIWFMPPPVPCCCIVTAPLAVKEEVASAKLIDANELKLVVVKLIVVHCAA